VLFGSGGQFNELHASLTAYRVSAARCGLNTARKHECSKWLQCWRHGTMYRATTRVRSVFGL